MPDNQTKIILGTAVAVGTLAAGLVYLYSKKVDESIPKKWKRVGQVIDLYCFPVKSCAPIKSASFDCHLLGLKYEGIFDRSFIVSRKNQQTTGRVYPNMVLIQPKVIGNQFILSAPNKEDFVLNLDELRKGETIKENVECWYSKVDGVDAGDEAANWLSEYITGKSDEFRLVFYPHEHPTKGVGKEDRIYKAYRDDDAGTYHDKTSYMLINQASVDELNSHLDHVVKPLQFRPNIVVQGPGAYEEDHWKWIRIGDNVIYRVLKPCTRCIFTNIDPETGTRNPDKQPFKYLVANRTIIKGATPVIGTQLGIRVFGKIAIGDDVYIEDESEA